MKRKKPVAKKTAKKTPKDLPKNRFGNIPIKEIAPDKFQLTYYPNGKRKRTIFETYTKALDEWTAHQSKVRQHGKASAQYDREAHLEFLEAKRIIREAIDKDVHLSEVAREWLRLRKSNEDAPETVNEAIQLFRSTKDSLNRSKRHKSDLKSRLDNYAESFGKRPLKSISGNETLVWLLTLKVEKNNETVKAAPRTIWNYFNTLSNFWNYCDRRKWIDESPTKSILEDDLPTVPKAPNPILTVDQTQVLMNYVEKHCPRHATWFAIQLFLGFRKAEANRFKYEWIDREQKRVVIPGWFFDENGEAQQGSKTQDDWAIHDIEPNFWKWFDKYGEESGKVPYPFQKEWHRIRDHLIKETELEKWPDNGARNSFCTYHISAFKNPNRTALILKHSNSRTLHNKYLATLATEEIGRSYFKISPA